MGLDNRDYMRERKRRAVGDLLKDVDRPFTPPSKDSSFLFQVFIWVCVAFLGYKAAVWWEQKKAQRVPTPRPVVKEVQQDPASRMQHAAVSSEPLARSEQAILESRPRVTQPVPAAAAVERPQTGATIYLCRDYGGGSFWSSNHCNQHNALIDRISSVPPGMPFQQQVHIAEQSRQALASTTQIAINAPPAQSASANNKQVCQSLDDRVNQLDAMARQPQSAAMQDWIRTQRQKTRDEQFRIRC